MMENICNGRKWLVRTDGEALLEDFRQPRSDRKINKRAQNVQLPHPENPFGIKRRQEETDQQAHLNRVWGHLTLT